MLSDNEIVSLEEICAEYGLETNDPLLYGLYLSKNPLLEIDEIEKIKLYMNKLINKKRNLDRYNINYMERHLKEQK